MNNLSINLPSSPHTNLRKTDNKYREAANALFQKLNSLQQASQTNKSHMHSALITQLNQKENKFFEGLKNKTDQYGKILKIVASIEREVEDQRNQQEKVDRAVAAWIETADRDIAMSFDKLQKEKIKSETVVEQWIDGKIESFILKNKNAWNRGPLIKSEPYMEEISQCVKDHQRFLQDFGKQCDRLRKETAASIKDLIRMTEQQVTKSEEDQVRAFLKAVHMEVTAKFKWLLDQRIKTEERVLSVLERVVASCLPKTQNQL